MIWFHKVFLYCLYINCCQVCKRGNHYLREDFKYSWSRRCFAQACTGPHWTFFQGGKSVKEIGMVYMYNTYKQQEQTVLTLLTAQFQVLSQPSMQDISFSVSSTRVVNMSRLKGMVHRVVTRCLSLNLTKSFQCTLIQYWTSQVPGLPSNYLLAYNTYCFNGRGESIETGYKACLWLRSAIRVLVLLAEGPIDCSRPSGNVLYEWARSSLRLTPSVFFLLHLFDSIILSFQSQARQHCW